LPPDFNELFFLLKGAYMSAAIGTAGRANVFSPAINPTTNGMGTLTLASTFAQGGTVDTTKYAAVNLECEVTTNITGGTVAPVVTINGTNEIGGADTWTATFLSVNPTAGTKVNATNAQGRRCIAVTGMSVPGAAHGTAGVFRTNSLVERTIT
jgi:hypothetical protein